jgi:hypothetical protein
VVHCLLRGTGQPAAFLIGWCQHAKTIPRHRCRSSTEEQAWTFCDRYYYYRRPEAMPSHWSSRSLPRTLAPRRLRVCRKLLCKKMPRARLVQGTRQILSSMSSKWSGLVDANDFCGRGMWPRGSSRGRTPCNSVVACTVRSTLLTTPEPLQQSSVDTLQNEAIIRKLLRTLKKCTVQCAAWHGKCRKLEVMLSMWWVSVNARRPP